MPLLGTNLASWSCHSSLLQERTDSFLQAQTETGAPGFAGSEDRSMGTLMYQWVSRGCDLERSMRIARDADLILPELLPQFFKETERLEGDGGVGTIRLMTLGPAITGGEERTNKERVLEYDEEGGTMAWEMVDDHRYSKLVTSLKVVECSNGDDCILHWQMDYEPRDPSTLPPEDIKMVHFESMKAIQNHCDQHPHWP